MPSYEADEVKIRQTNHVIEEQRRRKKEKNRETECSGKMKQMGYESENQWKLADCREQGQR